MTNAAHTPGPWSYNRDEGGIHGHVISTVDYIICDLPDAGNGAAPHTEANARLIAAAPELFDALQFFFNIMHDYRSSVQKGYVTLAKDMARAALASAKGGSI